MAGWVDNYAVIQETDERIRIRLYWFCIEVALNEENSGTLSTNGENEEDALQSGQRSFPRQLL